jgi:hypothetical protein
MYKNSVRTSKERYYVSAAETSRLMLFREKIAVYCENHMKQIYFMDRMQSFSMLKQVVHIVTNGF